jgi:hypothetical protein
MELFDDSDLYDALYGERVARHVARDSNPESSDSQSDSLLLEQGQVTRAFATMPPPFSDRNRYRAAATTKNSCFHTVDELTPGVLTRDQYWVNNHPALISTMWATLTAHLPIIPPATETTEIKNIIFNSYTQRLQDADSEWMDKTSLFLSSFEELVRAASLEADAVIADFNNYGLDVFEFESNECYNNMYEQVNIGAGINFTNAERASIKWFKSALNVAPVKPTSDTLLCNLTGSRHAEPILFSSELCSQTQEAYTPRSRKLSFECEHQLWPHFIPTRDNPSNWRLHIQIPHMHVLYSEQQERYTKLVYWLTEHLQ